MNCHEAQHQIFAERDSVPDTTARAALEGHVAQCADCRRIRDDLTAALATWRRDAEKVVVPDAEREWHAVRRRIRGGAATGAEAGAVRSRRHVFAWITVPLGAAAACIIAVLALRQEPVAPAHPHRAQIAQADYVEAPGNNASIVISVDDKSGWVFVTASDEPKRG
jgi:hypothetical protein